VRSLEELAAAAGLSVFEARATVRRLVGDARRRGLPMPVGELERQYALMEARLEELRERGVPELREPRPRGGQRKYVTDEERRDAIRRQQRESKRRRRAARRQTAVA
jgi:hypothetical protein